MRKFALLILFIIVFSITQSQTRKEIWSKDIDYLKTELASRHINLFFQTDRTVFYNHLDSIKNLIDSKTDAELAIALQIVVAQMGDDHTSVDYYKKVIDKGKFPLFTYWYSDGLYVTHTTNRYQNILGTKLIAINHFPIDTVITKCSTLISKTNDAIIKHRTPGIITFTGVLEYFNIAKADSVLCSFVNDSEIIQEIWIKAITRNSSKEDQQFIEFKPEKIPLGMTDQKTFFWFKILDDGKTIYAQYNQCKGKEAEKKYGNKKTAKILPSFEKFKKDLIKQIGQPQIERLIFDMRYNPGGSSPQGTELVKELAEIEKINKKGNLFVLIGRRTFSSAIINTIDFRNLTNSIVVGEATSGKPNHYGEIRTFLLPNSGLTVTYSTKYFKYYDTEENSINPDFIVESSFSDFKNGIDPAVEWIQNYK